MNVDFKAGLEAILKRIDDRLEAVLPKALSGHAALGTAMKEGVLAPGKRLRPLMTVIAAEDLGGSTSAALDAGCAVEMVHAASLVLDDLPCMDDATLRRGRPAVHIGHGQDVAVLVSIAALSGSYQILSEIPDLPADARIDCVGILSRAVGVRGLVGGQFEDLRGGREKRQVARIAAANGLKTGSLFSAAVEIGGVVAGVRDGVRADLRAFAEELGHAFQLLDDLLDGAPSADMLGKNVGQDRNKSTIVSIMGPAATRKRIERHIAGAEERLALVFGERSRMLALTQAIFDTALRPVGEAERRAARTDAFPSAEAQEIGAR